MGEESATATASVEAGVEGIAKASAGFSVSATVSYDGKNGKTNSITETQTVEDSLLLEVHRREDRQLQRSLHRLGGEEHRRRHHGTFPAKRLVDGHQHTQFQEDLLHRELGL